jgi:imidazolonepropionase-like amidohydrolase
MSHPRTVIIDGERISDCPHGVNETIDASGKYLIPGLIESHAHPSGIDSLEALTSYGVTTVMNMACKNYTACERLRGQSGLADYYSAGIPAQGPNSSHAINMKTPADQLVYPDSNPEQLVDWAIGNNSDYYKITVERNGPSQEMQISLVNAAHALGKQAMSHAADIESYLQAINSRTDGIQHTPSDGNLSQDAIKALKAQEQIFVTPTMAIFKYAYSNQAVMGFVAGSAVTGGNSSFSNVHSNVAAMHEAGIPILAGTDAVGKLNENVTIPFGLTLHEELQNLVAAGLSPVEALNAATRVAAKWHGLLDRGVVELGKRADLILLNSNPLLNISNTLDMEKIWVAGREYLDVSKHP